MQQIVLLDFQILKAIQGLRTPTLDQIMAVITHLGDAGWLWVVLSAAFLFFYKKAFKKDRRVGFAMAIGLLLCLFTVDLSIKLMVRRPRPFTLGPTLGFYFNTFIKHPKDFSFPSGHSASSFAAALPLLLFRTRFGLPMVILAALIAFSRLYFGVHYPTDVLVGALLGLLWGMVGTMLARSAGRKWPILLKDDHGKAEN